MCQRLNQKVAADLSLHASAIVIGEKFSQESFLNAIGDTIKNKTIVAFGEATHGTQEFEQAFKSLATDLVLYEHFNVVLLAEANFADTRALNEYVISRHGEPDEAVRWIRGYPSPVIESGPLELARWIASYNSNKPAESRVWMLGLDASNVNGAAYNALKYCERQRVELPMHTYLLLSELAFLPGNLYPHYFKTHSAPEILGKLEARLMAIYSKNAHRDDGLENEWLLQSVATLPTAIRFAFSYFKSETRDPGYRDSVMFKNVQWIQMMRPNAKMLIYAHNAHIERLPSIVFGGKATTRLGWQLSASYQSQYYSIGSEVWKGEYGINNGKKVSVPSSNNKLGQLFSKTFSTPALVKISETRRMRNFFNNRSKYGITYGNMSERSMISPLRDPGDAFDALLYIPYSTAKHNPKANRDVNEFSINHSIDLPYTVDVKEFQSLKINITANFKAENSAFTGQGCYAALLYLDSARAFVDLDAIFLSSGVNFQHAFEIPKNAKHVLITIVGNRINDLSLTNYRINETSMNERNLKFFGNGFNVSYPDGEVRITRVRK